MWGKFIKDIRRLMLSLERTKKGPLTKVYGKRCRCSLILHIGLASIKHYLNVMHIEKNVCNSLIGILLNIQGKTKDGKSSCLDMVVMGIIIPSNLPRLHTIFIIIIHEHTSFIHHLMYIYTNNKLKLKAWGWFMEFQDPLIMLRCA